VLLSLVAIPFRSATEFASGYSAEVLHRATPWVLAAIQVIAAAFLFVLAALNPTQHAAVGAGLLTAAGFAGVWLSARAILSSSDPYVMATRYVVYLARARKLSRDAVIAQTRRMLRGANRSPELVEMVSGPSQHSIVGAFIQQLGEGMRNALSQGQSAAALTLWQGALEMFMAQAKDRRGAVGPYEGITQGILELAEEAIERTDAAQLYAASGSITRSLAAVGALKAASPEYAMVLTTTRDLLGRQLDATWADDRSFVPNAAAKTLANLGIACLENGATEDGMRYLTTLADVALRAVPQDRGHISGAAVDGVVRMLPAIVSIDERSVRSECLGEWAGVATRLSPLKPIADARISLVRPLDVLLPGISISGGGLGGLFWQLQADAEALEDLVTCLCTWLSEALPILCKMDRSDVVQSLESGLTMVYNVALLAAGRLPTDSELARKIGYLVLSWTAASHPRGTTGRILIDDDVAELTWSTLLVCGYIAQSKDIADELARQILGIIALDWNVGAIHDEYVRTFIEGLLIVTDSDPDLARSALEERAPTELWGDWSGMHLPGLGHAPALNLNRSSAPPALTDTISVWAVGTWPALVG
jgi:hypothetical protein